MPGKTLPYSNSITFDKEECTDYKLNNLSNYLHEYFNNDYKEIMFSTTPSICSFEIILFILKQQDINVSLEELKNKLIENYTTYYDNYEDKILDILHNETKITFSNEIRNKLKINDMITRSQYYMTFLDMFLLLML